MISCSSPTLPQYSGENDVSPAATKFSGIDSTTRQDVVKAKCPSHLDFVDIGDGPASHRPFAPPSVLPVGINDARMSHCWDAGISIPVQIQYEMTLHKSEMLSRTPHIVFLHAFLDISLLGLLHFLTSSSPCSSISLKTLPLLYLLRVAVLQTTKLTM